MKVGDNVSVTFLYAYQQGEDLPFDATVFYVDNFFIGEIKVTSNATGLEYRLDTTQYETND